MIRTIFFNHFNSLGQFFGGGWNISPKSSLQDGELNIQIFKVTKIKAMKLFFLAKKNYKIIFECHQYSKVRNFVFNKVASKENVKIIFLNDFIFLKISKTI